MEIHSLSERWFSAENGLHKIPKALETEQETENSDQNYP